MHSEFSKEERLVRAEEPAVSRHYPVSSNFSFPHWQYEGIRDS